MSNINSALVKAAVDALTSKVNGVIATATDSVSAAALALGYRDTTLAYKNQADAAAALALQYKNDVASAIVYQDLSSIALSKGITATAMCIDTSPNPPLSVQRATSWFAELGPMPATKVVLVTVFSVTIYDGDDPSHPVWATFNSGVSKMLFRGDFSCVSLENGILSVGSNNTNGGVSVVDFSQDMRTLYYGAETYVFNGNISERNIDKGQTLKTATGGIVNRVINAVAMHVYDDAPVDPVSGLQIPTIAVGTAGGVSVILDDGTVVDSGSTFPADNIIVTEQGLWWTASGITLHFATWSDIEAGDGFGDVIAHIFGGSGLFRQQTRFDRLINLGSNQLAWTSAASYSNTVRGLQKRLLNYADQTKGMSALITSSYNTGWMVGDIKGAFLSSTDTASLVASEQVTNGTFDVDLSGWTQTGNNANNFWEFSAGKARVVSDGGFTPLQQTTSLVVGKRYCLTVDVTKTAGSVKVGTNSTVDNISSSLAAGANSIFFTASATTLYFSRVPGVVDCTIDNVSLKLADADRSVNANGLIVNGTITRTPVA